MNDDLDGAIARVASARRMATTAQKVVCAAQAARSDAFKNVDAAEKELQERLNKRIEAIDDAS